MKKKRFLSLIGIVVIFSLLTSCTPGTASPGELGTNKLRLSDFVGVWTEEENQVYYRFTPNSLYYRYNELGEVVEKGEVAFNGETFVLTDGEGRVSRLKAKNRDGFVDADQKKFTRTDSPSSLISSQEYQQFFNLWYEDGNLEGNVLIIAQPDVWLLQTPTEKVLAKGSFFAYADEEEYLYLYEMETGDYYARLRLSEDGLTFEKTVEDRHLTTRFSTEENAIVRYLYFKDKGISCNYYTGSGSRLLRNGGAVYNDSHDYKKMPVNCRIDLKDDHINEQGLRELDIVLTYEFDRDNLPTLSGNRIYNSVHFTQCDYYTGEIFSMDNSSGNEYVSCSWITEHDAIEYKVECDFSSRWEYPQYQDVFVRWSGTYHLTMPADYDGFVICLRPVYNSYSAQIASPIQPQEGTLLLEELGEDVEKSIICRIEAFDLPDTIKLLNTAE